MKPDRKIAPYKTTLNQANAYWMAKIAKEVYLKISDKDASPDEDAILNALKKEDSDFISVFGANKNSAQAALIEHKDYLCMAFRGTDELADWLDNINAFTVQELFGEFHRGFWHSLDDVWEPINTQYEKLKKEKPRPLLITGHSLGGAMATIAASKLTHLDLPFTNVYTFGQPRALSRDTARIFNVENKGKYFRFHNNNDLVTRVPARLMGYSHIGTYLYISEEEKIHEEPGFWFKFMDYFDGAVSALREKGIDGIEDHNMDKYLKAIEKWDRET